MSKNGRAEENKVKRERIKVLLSEGLETRAIATRMGVSMNCVYAIRDEIRKKEVIQQSEQA